MVVAGPAFGQPAAPVAPPASDQAAMHEKCKATMGARMDAKRPHEHSADKQGISGHPRGVPLTKAEMEKMHEQCAKIMARAEAAPKK
jgi:hypothetical protein